MARFRLGVVDIVYAALDGARAKSVAAKADGFEHIDTLIDDDPASLVLPVGCPTAFPKPQPGWCATPAPARDVAPDIWDRAVRWWHRSPGALIEPWAGAMVNSLETMRAFADAVPGVRFLIDTGHVADWGGDPLEVLEFADHVQLRQGSPGHTSLHADDAAGVVDFAAVIDRLVTLGYRGCLSIEYFDLPEHGWPLDDPRQWANDLATRVRPLL